MKTKRLIAAFLVSLGLAIASPALAVVSDATNLFTITKTGFVLNRTSNTFDTTVTLKNTTPFTIAAPIQLVVSNLPAGVTLSNASGTTSQGNKYVTVTVPGNQLIQNALVSGVLKFANPNRVAITATITVLGDIPQAAVGLPPDPGEAGKATVAGIDSNGNGVRDDVERWISSGFPDSVERAHLSQVARALQLEVTAFPSSSNDEQNALLLDKAVTCIGRRFADIDRAIHAHADLVAAMLDTEARVRADQAFQRRVTGTLLQQSYANDGCE